MSFANFVDVLAAIHYIIQIANTLGKVVCNLPRVRDWLVAHNLRDPRDFGRPVADLANLQTVDRMMPEPPAGADNLELHPLRELVVVGGAGIETYQPAFEPAPPVSSNQSDSHLADALALLRLSDTSPSDDSPPRHS